MSSRSDKQGIKPNPAIGIIKLFNNIFQELGEKFSFIEMLGYLMSGFLRLLLRVWTFGLLYFLDNRLFLWIKG